MVQPAQKSRAKAVAANFETIVDNAIHTAVGNSLLTCNVSIVGRSNADVQLMIRDLRINGYTATATTSTLTISW